ncbi:MAG: C-GCAxxG-C-C family protein [candidate division FCPU426 bacterium]
MSKIQFALEKFKSGFSCTQAVLSAFAEDFGLKEELALKLATGFGAGCGRTGQTCGAVTGAYLVLGLKHGRATAEDMPAREKTYRLVREFNRRFKAKHNSINCTELMGLDLGNPEEYKKAADQDLFRKICVDLIKTSVTLVEELLVWEPGG